MSLAVSLLAVSLAAPEPPDLRFEAWFEEREVAVSIARVSEGPPWLRAVAEIPAPAERVFEVLTRYDGYREFFGPAVAEAAVLESSGLSARIHFVWRYPFPFRNRDGIVAYRGERRDDGSFLLSYRDAAAPGDPKSGVRIQRIAGEARIEPLGPDRCRVTYTYFGDLGGSFPKAAEEKAWRRQPVAYILAIRRELGLPIPAP